MDFEGIMPSEISETEKDKYHMISLRCGILKKKKRQTHRYKDRGRERGGVGKVGKRGSNGTNFQL